MKYLSPLEAISTGGYYIVSARFPVIPKTVCSSCSKGEIRRSFNRSRKLLDLTSNFPVVWRIEFEVGYCPHCWKTVSFFPEGFASKKSHFTLDSERRVVREFMGECFKESRKRIRDTFGIDIPKITLQRFVEQHNARSAAGLIDNQRGAPEQ